ncbi:MULTISPECIES: class I SAM-dependent methyltransferase [Kamptonema]|uniref:class I SAM-dependent methyltransferase n=1 Tax=Kamptonema TaxID=1501433 RepID=UPI0001DAD003|nr:MULTISPECIES: class I SAM-dependent methyltransferase [Kamptonema]CBN55125.1 Similar to Methylase involved in ubiquinone/menaquinone biosynthesis [Kamptonema sp. PCC 6506]
MSYVDFITKVHTSTKRDYVARVVQHDKADCATIAKQYGQDYWDGDRQYGYGGYRYDGRWLPIAKEIVKHYDLKPGDKILDVGCGKAYLLYEFSQAIPGVEVAGIDISQYGIDNAKEEVKPFLQVGNATKLPFEDNTFDFVVSILTLHNLYNYELYAALQEIERVGNDKKYIVVESYRNERERVNLLYWQLTCESFYTPNEWEWCFKQSGYRGDYGCIFFE